MYKVFKKKRYRQAGIILVVYLSFCYLNFALSIPTSRIDVSLGLHRLVASGGADGLLGSTLDVVCDARGLLLGAGGHVCSVGFGLLDLA